MDPKQLEALIKSLPRSMRDTDRARAAIAQLAAAAFGAGLGRAAEICKKRFMGSEDNDREDAEAMRCSYAIRRELSKMKD